MGIFVHISYLFSQGAVCGTCLNTEDSPSELIWTNATDTVGYVYVLGLNLNLNCTIWNVKFFDTVYFHPAKVVH